MKQLQMPSSYAFIPEDELYSITGGGEFADALSSFFDNLHLNALSFGHGLLSFSFTFVPTLLFKVVKTGVVTVFNIYNALSDRFGFSDDTVDRVQQFTRSQSNTPEHPL